MCHPPTCVYRVYIAACCVICLIGAVAVIAIGMALGYRMGEDSVYNFKENRPTGIAVTSTNREQMLEVQSHFKHITTSLTGSGIVSGTISMIGGYGACCNLALALYLFMVGVAMLVVAEVATGGIVYYKQTLIMETLSEFRSNGICGTICFLDDLVSRQLMSAVIIVLGMTVLQVGQIICAYCIVRRLSTPKPVRNIQHAVRRMTAHLFNIQSTAVATGAAAAAHCTGSGNHSVAEVGSPASNPGPVNPAAIMSSFLLPSFGKEKPQEKHEKQSTGSSHPTTPSQQQPPPPKPAETPSSANKKPILVSEGAQTDDLEELSRPLLSSRRIDEENVPLRRSVGSSTNTPMEVVEVVEVVEESTTVLPKSCLRYAVSSRPTSVSSSKDLMAAASDAVHKARISYQTSNNIGRPSGLRSGGDLVDTTTSAQGYTSASGVASDSTATDAEPDNVASVVVLPCLSQSPNNQQHAANLSQMASVSAGSRSLISRNEQTAAAAAAVASNNNNNNNNNNNTLTQQPSNSSCRTPGRVAKLIPSSCQSSLPAPHFVRKLNDFQQIQNQTSQLQAQGSPSPTSRRRHLMIPVAQPSPPPARHYQQAESILTGVTTMSTRPYSMHTQKKTTSSVSEEYHHQQPPVVTQTLRFAALPPSPVIHGQHALNMANNRRARSYTNVGSTDEEAFEAADYIDLRELRRSPGTPGRVARFGHLYNNRNALCSPPQQPPIFPQPAHAVGAYPDKSQWRLPEIRTLYVSYV